MSEKDIKRWHAAVIPKHDHMKEPWTIKSGGSWDMTQVKPIPDDMLAELMQKYHCGGTPWNCRSFPVSEHDREWMFLLYYSMQGLVARMRLAEKDAADARAAAAVPMYWCPACHGMRPSLPAPAEGTCVECSNHLINVSRSES